jgi:hypothetical protein
MCTQPILVVALGYANTVRTVVYMYMPTFRLFKSKFVTVSQNRSECYGEEKTLLPFVGNRTRRSTG